MSEITNREKSEVNIKEYFRSLGPDYIGYAYILNIICLNCTKEYEYELCLPVLRNSEVDEPRLVAELQHVLDENINRIRHQTDAKFLEKRLKWEAELGAGVLDRCPGCNSLSLDVKEEDTTSHWIDVFEDDTEILNDENILNVL